MSVVPNKPLQPSLSAVTRLACATRAPTGGRLNGGVQAIVAKSFGAINERNAISAGRPIVTGDLISTGIADGEVISIDLTSGKITRADGSVFAAEPFSPIQKEI